MIAVVTRPWDLFTRRHGDFFGGLRITRPTSRKALRISAQGAWLIGIGISAGLALTFTLTAAVGKVLVLVSATDPLTFVVVTLLLAASALAACYIPAHRATAPLASSRLTR